MDQYWLDIDSKWACIGVALSVLIYSFVQFMQKRHHCQTKAISDRMLKKFYHGYSEFMGTMSKDDLKIFYETYDNTIRNQHLKYSTQSMTKQKQKSLKRVVFADQMTEHLII